MLTYATLFLWSFLAATVLPLGSEPALAGIVMKTGHLALPIAIATAGNYLGACTTYLIGRGLRGAMEKKKAAKDLRAERIVNRWGQPALLLSWVPIIGDAIVAVAGASRMPFFPFSFWTIVGKAARYGVVGWVAWATL
jgi:membrane protein YqaA with SNARE-associated domain